MWVLYALVSAVAAAFVAILGKLGVKDLDPTLATTVRSIIMAIFLILVSVTLHKFEGFSMSSLSSKEWIFIVLAGIAGAISWLFYFIALKDGSASGVVAVDRLSIVFVVFLAALFLGETLSFKSLAGAMLVFAGALLISLK